MQSVTHETLRYSFSDVQQAYMSFYDALREYETQQNDFIRDSVLQRFEYCVEGSWKMGRSILIYEKYPADALCSPNQCIKKMLEHRLIDDVALRTDLLQARNTLSHIYSGSKAQQIFLYIQEIAPEFATMEQRFTLYLNHIYDDITTA